MRVPDVPDGVLEQKHPHYRIKQRAQGADLATEAAAKLNYIPNFHARSINIGLAQTIAVALDFEYTAQAAKPFDPYWAHMLGAINTACRGQGFQMIIVGPDDHMSAPDLGILGIQQKRFDSLIVFGRTVRHERTKMYENPPVDIPLVIIQALVPTTLPVVDFDSDAGVQLAVRHLAELGHRALL